MIKQTVENILTSIRIKIILVYNPRSNTSPSCRFYKVTPKLPCSSYLLEKDQRILWKVQVGIQERYFATSLG